MSLINKKWRYINNNLIHAIWDQTLAKHGRNNKKETSESEKFENKHPERASRSQALPHFLEDQEDVQGKNKGGFGGVLTSPYIPSVSYTITSRCFQPY